MASDISAVTAAIARKPTPSVPAPNAREARDLVMGGNLQLPPGVVLPVEKLKTEVLEAIPKGVRRALEYIAASASGSGHRLEFRVDRGSGQAIVTVINSTTGEVVRQIPAKEAVLIARSLGIEGGLVNTSA